MRREVEGKFVCFTLKKVKKKFRFFLEVSNILLIFAASSYQKDSCTKVQTLERKMHFYGKAFTMRDE
jgi:hypothetical protein